MYVVSSSAQGGTVCVYLVISVNLIAFIPLQASQGLIPKPDTVTQKHHVAVVGYPSQTSDAE